jgi:hypothetical protein
LLEAVALLPLGPEELVVIVRLVVACDGAWLIATVAEVADLCGLAVRAVRRALGELVHAGLVRQGAENGQRPKWLPDSGRIFAAAADPLQNCKGSDRAPLAEMKGVEDVTPQNRVDPLQNRKGSAGEPLAEMKGVETPPPGLPPAPPSTTPTPSPTPPAGAHDGERAQARETTPPPEPEPLTLDDLRAELTRRSPHQVLSPQADVALGQWCSMRWPPERIRFGLAVAAQELTGPDGRWPDEKHALRYARRAMENAQDHEWKPGAERPDKAVPARADRSTYRGRRSEPEGELAYSETADGWREVTRLMAEQRLTNPTPPAPAPAPLAGGDDGIPF